MPVKMIKAVHPANNHNSMDIIAFSFLWRRQASHSLPELGFLPRMALDWRLPPIASDLCCPRDSRQQIGLYRGLGDKGGRAGL